MTLITVSREVDVDVDVETEDVIDEIPIADLRQELIKRGVDIGVDDPLVQIWKAVTYQGIALEDVVDELMRERGWRWPPAHCKGVETG